MITVQVQFLLECYRLEVCEGRTNNHNLLRTLQSLAQVNIEWGGANKCYG